MEKNGWIFNTTHSDISLWRNWCGEDSWFGDHDSMNGSITTTFKGSGTATLSFGNCGPKIHSLHKVCVLKNGDIISEATGNALEKEIAFSFNKGDNLIIKEYYAIIKINSLDITCN